MSERPALRREAFARGVALPGWSAGSRWGYDAVLECYWADLLPDDGAPDVQIGPEHLLSTVTGLARAVAVRLGVGDDDVYLALTA